MSFDYENLTTRAQSALSSEPEYLQELRNCFLECDDALDAPEFAHLSAEQQQTLIALHKTLHMRIKELEAAANAHSTGEENTAANPPESSLASPDETLNAAPLKAHDPQAEALMEQAESNFYSGNYQEAIRLFDKVLEIEPNWERARHHRSEAENYLRTGYIPQVALPAQAASDFGKAQSAARLGRFADALDFFNKAKAALEEAGIFRWQEGLDFEKKLHENIEAEAAYHQGLSLFQLGKLEEAIERIEAAYRATGLPRYNDKAIELRDLKKSVSEITERLAAPELTILELNDLAAKVDLLHNQYGENPAFQNLRRQIDLTLPKVGRKVLDKSRKLKAKADQSNSLEEAMNLTIEASNELNIALQLGWKDEQAERLHADLRKLSQQLEQYENDLEKAIRAYHTHQNWPADAYRLSRLVRALYPADPRVERLSKQLKRYRLLRLSLRGAIFLVILSVLALIGKAGFGYYQTYALRLTPSATPTATATFTATPTATSTVTPTASPTATNTLTPTATPIAALTLRDVWARNGCYEGFTAVGRIPANSTVVFLPAERRFDAFGRECLLVEYRGFEVAFIGWVLLADLGADGTTPTPSITPSP